MPVLPKRTPYYAYRAGAEVARVVPAPVGEPLARGLAQVVGLGVHGRPSSPGASATCDACTDPASAAPTLRRAVTATFDSYGRYFYELFRLPSYEPQWIDDHFACHRDRARRGRRSPRGSGAVLALPHLGNWDFAGAWLARQGYTVTVVAEPVEPPELFDWFVETRAPRSGCA